MLYQIYEAQRAFLEPFANIAEAIAKNYGNPRYFFSQMPTSQRMAASLELFNRFAKDYEKPKFGIHKIEMGNAMIAIDERVVLEKPFCQLRRFKRFSDEPEILAKLRIQPVVLIVAPLSGHHATLLRETVRTMLEGHKVYITDWTDARMVPLSQGEFGLDDYVNYIRDFIRFINNKYESCHVVSVCQPTVPVLGAISLMASAGEKLPQTMTMMGGPIDARMSPTSVNNLATKHSMEWFENNVIYKVPNNYPGAGRRVYPGFLQHTGFVAMNPDRHASSHWDFFQNLIRGNDDSVESHRQFYDEYNAVLDMDAAFYLDTIKTVFQDYALAEGTWQVQNTEGQLETVRPQDIKKVGLLTIEGEHDDISGSGQTRAAMNLCAGIPATDKKYYEVRGAGHYGIFSGSRWRKRVYPEIRAFIAKYNIDPDGKLGTNKIEARNAAPASLPDTNDTHQHQTQTQPA